MVICQMHLYQIDSAVCEFLKLLTSGSSMKLNNFKAKVKNKTMFQNFFVDSSV